MSYIDKTCSLFQRDNCAYFKKYGSCLTVEPCPNFLHFWHGQGENPHMKEVKE